MAGRLARADRGRTSSSHARGAHYRRPVRPGLRHHVHQLLHGRAQTGRGPGARHPRRRLPGNPQRSRAEESADERTRHRVDVIVRGLCSPESFTQMVKALHRASLLLLCAPLVGCEKPEVKVAEAKPPVVIVATPISREVTDYEDFPGRTDAVFTVEVRARVTGYMDKVLFNDGDEVQKDDLLFVIDPRPYKADLERAEATVAQGLARLKRLEADNQRAQQL